MSNRWHQKFHRFDHHTAPSPNIPDSSYDPIASQASPFLGTFYLSGGLSANGNITASNISSNVTISQTISTNGTYVGLGQYVSITISGSAFWLPLYRG